jgi:hypothetical protein
MLPALASVPINRIARGTELSIAHCGRVNPAETLPHARWREVLAMPRAEV